MTKRKNMKLSKIQSRTSLCRKADKLWSTIILLKGRCEICGAKATNPHHFIGRKNLTLRHDIRNGIALCYTHHIGGKESAHGDPQWICAWMMQHRPEDYNYIWETKEKLSVQVDYEQKIKDLQALLELRTANKQ